MKERCVVCGRPYDQILSSQKTCSGTCERMRPALLGDDSTEAPPPLKVVGHLRVKGRFSALPTPEWDEPDWRTCSQDGCGVDFRVEKKRGRPAKKCPQHRRSA